MKKHFTFTIVVAALLQGLTTSAVEWSTRDAVTDTSGNCDAVSINLPVKKRPTQNPPTKVSQNGNEYLVVGKSIFNSEGANVYPDGGYMVSFPCYVDFNDATGRVTFNGLFREETATSTNCATLNWDAATGKIHANTPDSFENKSDCVYMGDFDSDVVYALQGGELYGIGYWNAYPEMNMDVSANRSLITPTSAYACRAFVFNENSEEYVATRSFDEVMFDTRMYLRSDGVSAIPSTDILDFGNSFVGNSKSLSFAVVNPGREEGDFVVSISNPAFTVNTPTGSLEAGNYTSFEVTFCPTQAGDIDATLTVMSEETECTIQLHGFGENTPDFGVIVSNGADLMTFDTSNEYPFVLSDEYGDRIVAVSSNAGVAHSSSWFETAFTISEGDRGVLSYSGYFYPRWASYDVFNVYLDGTLISSTDTSKQYNGDLNGKLHLKAGTHIVRFEYEKGAIFNSPTVEMGEDYAYISNISLDLSPYKAQDASMNRDSYDFGTVYTVDGLAQATSQGDLILRNDGYETLDILSIGDSENFKIIAPKSISPDETSFLTITFIATEKGNYDQMLTIVTSAGEFTVHLTAVVEDTPDYSLIVKKGDFTFVTGRHPFIVEDGYAVNPPLPKDGEEIICEFTAFYNVPQGKYGVLTWNGHADCGDGDEGMIMFDTDAYSLISYNGDVDAGCYTANPIHCWVTPGAHSISFGYLHEGLSGYTGTNTFKISDLSLELVDEIPAMVLWEPTPVEFKPLYPGTMDPHLLTLYNLDYVTEETMDITSVEIPENFFCQFNAASFSGIPAYSSARLTIAATPTEVGQFCGEFVLHTSRGDVSIPVTCEGKDNKGLIYHEEFDTEDMPGWTIIDKNGDEKTWAFGSDKLANTGTGCLTFNSNFLKQDAEDYIVSPEITIPQDGAKMIYYRGYSSNDVAQDYKVLAGEGDNLDDYVVVGEESEVSLEGAFVEIVVSLDQFAAKTIHICFANYTKQGEKNLLKIDDLAVISSDAYYEGVESIVGSGDVVETKYYTVVGTEVSHPDTGLYIVMVRYADGSYKTYKVKF